ncbi:MotA/TolQ/ExbB proton channel family protein [Fimbriimonas ginsengisoli]|uniref:MotA/TolQ/ExbB proton channel n=1 Tax=Fimbriimonas ginsengisoli Gsoil 348 TaxID=661478 RepID=A0A068NSP6_FIMGI|nr:MotA/TolQ/ExbB proton channel family protein [Fimbriimonas ginsengisoli]AIE86461.1 MotA/TolQ/ExbB proton channel [Fimbriimonas ginsengisoli Gsoil 348]
MNGVLDFLQKGGVMMYPLILCSILMIALIIERAVTLRKATVDAEELLDDIKGLYTPGGDSAKAIELSNRSGAIGRIFARGLRNASRSADAIEMAMEHEAANETPNLEANLAIIKTIVNVAPLLGLLGTIAGMITSFRAASQAGLSNPTQILGGISEALISTATGITLAVVGFIAHNYFANYVRKTIEDVEYFGAELVNYITGRVE